MEKIWEDLQINISKNDVIPITEGTYYPAQEQKKMIPSLPEVEHFFQQQKYPISEARKFFYYNKAKNWMLTNQLPVSDWKAMAQKWMLNSEKKKSTPNSANDKNKHANTSTSKNYDIPL